MKYKVYNVQKCKVEGEYSHKKLAMDFAETMHHIDNGLFDYRVVEHQEYTDNFRVVGQNGKYYK